MTKPVDLPAPPGYAFTGGPRYSYDAGEHWARRKHGGVAEEPRFIGKFEIAKCPKHFTQQLAEEVLNDPGTLRIRRASTPEPEADWVFAVVDGVLYRGMPTGTRGTVFHAFPECQKKFSQLPAWVRAEVERWAKQNQYWRAIQKWLERTP